MDVFRNFDEDNKLICPSSGCYICVGELGDVVCLYTVVLDAWLFYFHLIWQRIVLVNDDLLT